MKSRVFRKFGAPVCCALLAVASPAQAGNNGWSTASDVARDALVVAAISVPIMKHDRKGAIQSGASMLVATGESWALKSLIDERRPDGSDNNSFPSGHTTTSFAAAASLQNRYGWKIGLPAHVAAAFVGVARVEANKHHWHDVLAGAALGEITGLLITNKRNPNVQFFPWTADEGTGGGVSVAMRF